MILFQLFGPSLQILFSRFIVLALYLRLRPISIEKTSQGHMTHQTFPLGLFLCLELDARLVPCLQHALTFLLFELLWVQFGIGDVEQRE